MQIESYAPGRQVRFGSLNFTADIRGDLIFEGSEPQPSVPRCHDGHDFDLPSGSIREIAPTLALGINPEQIVPPEDGWMDPATEAAHS